MQRVGHLGVRSTVVMVLSALLLVCTGSFSPARQAPHPGPAVQHSAGLHLRTGPDPAAQPGTVAHRAGHAKRLDGSGPALVPARTGVPRPSYVAVARGTANDQLHATAQLPAHGRAPPV